MSEQQTKCELCGEPMPPGEEMFKYHGFSGPCPKSPMPVAEDESDEEAARPEGSGDSWAPPLRRPVPLATPKQQTPNLMEALKQSLRNAKLGEPTPPATPPHEEGEELCSRCGINPQLVWGSHCRACADELRGIPPATPQRGEPTCPGPDCPRCSGEYCDTHYTTACECDSAQRHMPRFTPATPQPGTKACGHRGPCECAHYIDPTRRALSPPPDVERLQQRWDTRDAALRALVEQLGTIWNDERNCNAARADMALWCRNEVSRLLEHEP